MVAATPNGISVISTLVGACLRVNWYPVTDATGYNVYRSQIAWDTFTKINSTTIPGITYYDTPPTPNDNFDNLWYYRVSSVDSSGESLLSGPFTYMNYAAFDEKPIPGMSWSSLF